MSYFADHLAWQQRVAQEFKATTQFNEQEAKTQDYYRYPDLVNYLLQTQKGPDNQFPEQQVRMSGAFS